MNKKDFLLSSVIGFFVGILLIPTLYGVGVKNSLLFAILPIFFLMLAIIGMKIMTLIAVRIPLFSQLGKFLAVGVLNTAIDFGVLNILSMATGITAGFKLGGVNIPGFTIAVLNSYFWNKAWVFEKKEGSLKSFGQFIAVSVGGLVLNSALVAFITGFIPPPSGITTELWLNIAKIIATIIAFVWNFLGYKFIVFAR